MNDPFVIDEKVLQSTVQKGSSIEDDYKIGYFYRKKPLHLIHAVVQTHSSTNYYHGVNPSGCGGKNVLYFD